LGGEFAKKKYKMSDACGFARPPGGGGNKWLVHNSTTGCFRNTILQIQHITTVITNFIMNTAFKTEILQDGVWRVMPNTLPANSRTLETRLSLIA
jgi:hypothetical protein